MGVSDATIKGLTRVSDDRRARRRQLAERLSQLRFDALVTAHLPNVRYLCGYTGSNGVLLQAGDRAVLFTDPRYTLQAKTECDVPVKIVNGPLWPAVAAEISKRKWTTIGAESQHLSHSAWLSAAALFTKAVKLKPCDGEIERLRSIKSADEIEAIRASVKLNSAAFAAAVKKIKVGMTEQRVATEIDYQMRKLGAEAPAFETIVAAGARSALPHARPTTQTLERDQVLLIDMGASLNGYASDMTRVVHLGKPSAEIRNVYEAVLEAQLAAIQAVGPGVPCSEVDGAARRLLKRRKLDRYFEHSTGHGLGLEIHESPRVGRKDDSPLQPGMVITIEPGVYLEGVGGVRIEDTVLVTEKGVDVLTPTSKEFLGLES